MSGLEAFSMVCNFMTVISFGLETAKLCRSIHDSSSSDPELVKHAQWIRENSEQLLIPRRPANTDAEKRLQGIASECLQCAKDIEQEVRYISPKKPGFIRAMKSTVKTVRRKPHLDKLKGRLEASRDAMNHVVITQILEECVESGKLNRDNFEALVRDQKAFKMAHEQWSRIVDDLIQQFHDRFQETITTACKRIEDKIDAVRLRQDEEQAYEKLLRSLEYDGMNARRSAIHKKHDLTFEWIFRGLDPDDISKSDLKLQTANGHDVAVSTGDADDKIKELKYGWKGEKAMNKQESANLLGWLQGDSRDLYWISGKPGSGKSTLMKFLVNDKRTKVALRSWRSQPEIISHFLWKPGTRLQNDLNGMLCSLLHQTLLIDKDIGTRLLHHKPTLRYMKKYDDWDLEDLKNTLFEAL
ncbi:hypothetical protein CGCSCA1_v007956 [Colletotrichum siamense]|nr:hypothetical protein CGCSCA1_v007956 [Colletotrichum siamense]